MRANSKSRSSCAGHAHHRAGAVLDQHEIRDPDRHRLSGERIDGACGRCRSLPSRPRRSCARCDPAPGTASTCARNAADPPRLGPLLDQRMLRRQDDEVRAVDRVDAGGEDLDRRRSDGSTVAGSSSGTRTRAPSDRPIQLRCIVRTFSGHSVELSHAVEQLVGVVRDPEEPLLEVARRHRACRSASRRRRRPVRWRAPSGSSGTS